MNDAYAHGSIRQLLPHKGADQMPKDKDTLEDIKKALEAATPGPWNVQKLMHEEDGYEQFISAIRINAGDRCVTSMDWSCPLEENAHLIANAPEWLRYLLKQIEQQQREIERLNGLLKVKEVHFNDGEVNEQEFAIQQLYIESKRVRDENEKLRREISSHGPEGRNYTNAQYVDLLLENERLKSVEHTLCLTIGEADKALQQSREENERLREAAKNWHDAAVGWESQLEQVKAELSAKDKVLEWYGDINNYDDAGEMARDILSRYTLNERGDSQNDKA